MQDGGKARRSHRNLPEILELEPNGKRHEGSLEDPSLVEELRVYERELETILERDVMLAAIPEFRR